MDWIGEIPSRAYIVGVLAFMVLYSHHQAEKRRERWEHRISDDIDEIVEWMKEIDPRMEEERVALDKAWEAAEKELMSFAPRRHMDPVRQKEEQGERTLDDPLRRKARAKQ